MIRYLEYYHKLPGYKAYSGRITDISLKDLTLSCGNETFTTPISPHMTSYREARERVVQMDRECVAGLKRSDITVKKYIPPHGHYWILFVVVTVTLTAFSMRGNFAPDGYLAIYVHGGFARFCWRVQPLVFYGM